MLTLDEHYKIGEEIDKRGIFIGCPLERFTDTSQDALMLCQLDGVLKDNTVLDLGAGCLRCGVWFIEYLNTNKYFAIEPNKEAIDIGRALFVDKLRKSIIDFTCLYNDDFGLDVFATRFDYIVVSSVFSHAPKWAIEKVVNQAGEMKSTIVGTYLPTQKESEDYKGDKWIGKSHESNVKGVVKHSETWIKELFKKNNMSYRLTGDVTMSQNWFIAKYTG